jgi:hypothetical protein
MPANAGTEAFSTTKDTKGQSWPRSNGKTPLLGVLGGRFLKTFRTGCPSGRTEVLLTRDEWRVFQSGPIVL